MGGLKRFQYVDKDHQGIVDDCIARIREKYGDKWNDYEEDSVGMMIVETFSYVTDLLLFYLDRQANETYLLTATERQNLINMCKLISYEVAGALAAQADILMTLKQPHVSDITLPKDSRLETQGGVVFETQADAVIPAGEVMTVVPVIEGETFEDQVGVSDGEAHQEFYLPRSGVIQLLELHVGARIWDAVDSVADRLSDESVYMVDLDAWGRARITFGDGRNGRIPGKNEKIKARYRVGGGTRGNVAANTITIMRDIATDAEGNRVSVNVTNPDPAGGGTEPESLERIKLWAPRHYETQHRCVTQTDYETMAMTFRDPDAGAVAKVRAFVRERSGEANVVRHYVLAYADEPGKVAKASQALKDALLKHLNKYKMLTDWLEIEDGQWRTVDIRGTVLIAGGFDPDKITAELNRRLKNLFDMETRAMGEPLRISDLYSALDTVEGIIHVELDAPVATVAAGKEELLMLGNVDLVPEAEGTGRDGTNW